MADTRSLLLSLLVLSSFSASRTNAQSTCSQCDDYHFFLARGNNEPYPGRQAFLVEATCDGIASCGYENLVYSALYTDLYCQTTYDGAIAGHVQITAYAEKCPNSKLILAGYSQGGQITGDILGGGGGYSFNGCFQPYTPAMDINTSPGNKIAAVIIFGDVRHNANQPYNYGNGSNINGFFPRNATQLANLAPYGPIMRNWCVNTDPICAANQSSYSEGSHLDYFDVDSAAAASWIHSVASMTSLAPTYSTVIPTSISGTVQDYATVPTGTPSGSVKLDTTWTDATSSPACTSTAPSFTITSHNTTSTSGPTSAAASIASNNRTSTAAVFPITGSSTGAAKGVSSASSTATAKPTSSAFSFRCSMHSVVGIVFGILALTLL